MTTTEVAPVSTANPVDGGVDIATLQAIARRTQQNVAELLTGADYIVGRAVVDKDSMVNVPFVVTSATFRKGTGKDSTGTLMDYVSLEVTTLDSDPAKMTDVVINDGSTGIRRQVVTYLVAKGLIVPSKSAPFDTDPDLSLVDRVPGVSPDGEWAVSFEGLKWVAARGLRRSDYTNEYGEATTFYLA